MEQVTPNAELVTRVENVEMAFLPPDTTTGVRAKPRTSETTLPNEWLRLSLDDTIALSFQNSKVLRGLGAQVTSNPQSMRSVYDAAIQVSDPNFGTQAALSQFDSNLTASLNHANNDDVFNNSILGGGATEVVQDLTQARLGINRTTWAGTNLAIDANVTYDNNDNVSSTFPSSYNSFWQASVRQPLLQGRGVAFNRIAGPNARTGFFGTSGFLISRINADISTDEFEKGVVAHVAEIINAYWEHYFAVKNFETVKAARDSSLVTWKTVKARFDSDLQGGEADAEAQAREQYFRFEGELTSALNGNPSQGVTGVFQAEANLRQLVGMPQADERMVWPADSPTIVASVFDWNALSGHALANRVEMRQQRRRIQQRELELLASKNFLLPRFDAVATFRNNGFGDRLAGGDSRFSSSFTDLASGDHNEWEFGVQLDMPVGFRQATVGVRNRELELMRERAILNETERQVLFELGASLRQTHQAFRVAQINRDRMDAANDAFLARMAAYEAGTVSVDLLLEAVERLAEAKRQFERSKTSFQVANSTVNRDSGSLLQEFGIYLDNSQVECGSEVRIARDSNQIIDEETLR